MSYSHNESSEGSPNLTTAPDFQQVVPWTLFFSPRKPTGPLLYRKCYYDQYFAPTIKEYVDVTTGEILQAKDVESKKNAPIRFGELVLQRQACISKLRPEIRPFAHFVLHFRNHRRGITPDIRTLCAWFGTVTNRRGSDIARYIPRLEEQGILHDSVMGPLFQLASMKKTRRDYLRESEEALIRFAIYQLKYLQKSPLDTHIAAAKTAAIPQQESHKKQVIRRPKQDILGTPTIRKSGDRAMMGNFSCGRKHYRDAELLSQRRSCALR